MTISSGHHITPLAGSARKLDGLPADLTRPLDYPAESVCTECGQPVRCERWFLSEWRHIDRFSIPPTQCLGAARCGGLLVHLNQIYSPDRADTACQAGA